MHDPIDGHGLIDEFVEHRIWKPAVASAAASGAKPTSTAMVQLPQPSLYRVSWELFRSGCHRATS
jgi:hypothetical protein